jgi:predicted Co/Zn/Cd cation transporter (cation efflux family)
MSEPLEDIPQAASVSPWNRPMVCTTIGLVGNIALSAGKLVFGLLAGSAALVADGFHSLADVLSDPMDTTASKPWAPPWWPSSCF